MPTQSLAYRGAWCVGGFLFPVTILTIGLIFEQSHPPTEADLAAAVVHPDRLRWWITGLVLGHIVASLVAVSSWPNRWYVWVLTALQLLFTLLCGLMSQMAVQGHWL